MNYKNPQFTKIKNSEITKINNNKIMKIKDNSSTKYINIIAVILGIIIIVVISYCFIK